MSPEEKRLKVSHKGFSQAAEDLRYAKYGLEATPPFLKGACYNSQQCAEKAIKAFLVFQGTPFKYIHDLRKLAELAGEQLNSDTKKLLTQVPNLTKYVVIARYPTDVDISIEMAHEAIRIADETYQIFHRIVFPGAEDV